MMVEQVRRGVCDRRHTRFATGGLLIADWPEAHAALILWWHSSPPLLTSPDGGASVPPTTLAYPPAPVGRRGCVQLLVHPAGLGQELRRRVLASQIAVDPW